MPCRPRSGEAFTLIGFVIIADNSQLYAIGYVTDNCRTATGRNSSPMAETVPAARRATAHDHRQLADALSWSVVQADKAVALGVLPPYDLKTPRWKAVTVDALTGRREELAAALDEGALLTEDEMIAVLGLEWGDWRRGRDHDIIPGPCRLGPRTLGDREPHPGREADRGSWPDIGCSGPR